MAALCDPKRRIHTGNIGFVAAQPKWNPCYFWFAWHTRVSFTFTTGDEPNMVVWYKNGWRSFSPCHPPSHFPVPVEPRCPVTVRGVGRCDGCLFFLKGFSGQKSINTIRTCSLGCSHPISLLLTPPHSTPPHFTLPILSMGVEWGEMGWGRMKWSGKE